MRTLLNKFSLNLSGATFLYVTLLTCLGSFAMAQDAPISGHIKLTGIGTHFDSEDLQSQSGFQNTYDSLTNLRLNYLTTKELIDFIIEGDLNHRVISNLSEQQALAEITGLNTEYYLDDQTSVFDLSKLISDEGNSFTNVRIDRLSIGYSKPDFSFRLGRQALSWGQGFAFQAFDIFNPFAPAAIDKEYKPGDDMALLSMQPAEKLQVEFLYLPRRDPITDSITEDTSSFAGRFNYGLPDYEGEVHGLLAKHYGEYLVGIGGNKSLYSSILRLDLTLSHEDLHHAQITNESTGSNNTVQFVANIDRSWSFLDRNWYGFVEYFYSGFGSSDSNLSLADQNLLSRLGRGELFTLGKNYLAIGLQEELTPLLKLNQLMLMNINSGSSLLQVGSDYDIEQNLVLRAFLTVGMGDGEFQSISGPNQTRLGRGDSLFLQLGYYF